MFTGYLILLSTIGYASTLECLACPYTTHPRDCEHYKTCAHDEKCFLRVARNPSGQLLYSFGCANDMTCAAHNIFGRRSEKLQRQTEICHRCCKNKHCNAQLRLCRALTHKSSTTVQHHHTHTKPAAKLSTRTTHTSQKPTRVSVFTNPVADPICFNKEEDGIPCAYIDMFNMCSATENSTFAYVLANIKCKRHCGLCTPTSTNTLAPASFPPNGVCADFEKDGITCAELDLYDICSSTYGLPYMFGHVKCRKHCGFCNNG